MNASWNNKRSALNSTVAALVLVGMVLSLSIPHAVKAVEEFGGVRIPNSADTLPETEQPLAGPGEGGGPGGATQQAFGVAKCAANLVAYIPFVNAITSVFTAQVPTKDEANVFSNIVGCGQAFLNVIQSTISSGGITALATKMKLDFVATGIMKTAIRVLRDMVIRWIATGRFEGPVFSTSFAIDASKIAENASRIFLSKLTKIDFCAGFDIPARPALSFDLKLGLECSLPSKLNSRSATIDFFLHPEKFSAADYALVTSKENLYPHVLARTLERKAEAEARAVSAFAAEFAAGQGFWPIKDPKTGKIVTPGVLVGQTVKTSIIDVPWIGSELSDDIQTAVVDIIDAAVRIMIEKGLAAAFPRT